MKYKNVLLRVITWLFRICIGVTFVFSGFVKAVDPWGTFYKFSEYTAAFGVPVVNSLVLIGVFGLCALEFLIGVAFLTGSYRRSSPIVAFIFMCVMLPLTLWIAWQNPVKDCGCFGDFLIISNWATFYKNVILMLMIIWLLKFNSRLITIISPAFQWLGVLFSLVYILIISLYGYFIQPIIDFRPYPINENLVEAEAIEEDEGNSYIFIYQKNGKQYEFTIDDELPDENDGWEFIERKEINSSRISESQSKSLRIWDKNGEIDETEEIFDENSKILLLLVPDLKTISPATTWKINEINDKSEKEGIKMIAVVSGTTEEISEWEDLSMPQYEIYTADDTAIKEVARGNPSLVFVNDGIIRWKSTLASVTSDKIADSNIRLVSRDFEYDNDAALRNFTFIYLISMVVLIGFTMLPRIRNAYKK